MSACLVLALGCGGVERTGVAAKPRPITPVLRVADVAAAMDFYGRAFGAQKRLILTNTDGSIEHSELVFGESIVWIDRSTETPLGLGATSGAIIVSVGDQNSLAKRLRALGAKQRGEGWQDPFGHLWFIASGNHGQITIEPLLAIDAKTDLGFYRRAFGGDVDTGLSRARFGAASVRFATQDQDIGLRTPKSLGGAPFRLHLYVSDCSETYNDALKAGAKSRTAPTVKFWGDRWAMVEDSAGHSWGIGTRLETLSQTEMQRRMEVSRLSP